MVPGYLCSASRGLHPRRGPPAPHRCRTRAPARPPARRRPPAPAHRLRDGDQHADDLVDGRARRERRRRVPLERRLGRIERDQRPEPHERVRLGVETRRVDVRELHRQDVPDVPLVAERHASERVLVLGHRPSSLRSSARHSTSGRTREHRPDGMKAGLRPPGATARAGGGCGRPGPHPNARTPRACGRSRSPGS